MVFHLASSPFAHNRPIFAFIGILGAVGANLWLLVLLRKSANFIVVGAPRLFIETVGHFAATKGKIGLLRLVTEW